MSVSQTALRLRAQWLSTRRPLSSQCQLFNSPAPRVRVSHVRGISRTSAQLFHSTRIVSSSAAQPEGENGSIFAPLDTFPRRHIGPSPTSADQMLQALDPPVKSMDEFVKQVLPADILSDRELKVEGPVKQSGSGPTWEGGFSESQLLERLKEIAGENKVYKSYIGCGYAGTRVPEVIKRNVLENPAWYTSYTPYQPEISQGRLESLLNFQTMCSDLTWS